MGKLSCQKRIDEVAMKGNNNTYKASLTHKAVKCIQKQNLHQQHIECQQTCSSHTFGYPNTKWARAYSFASFWTSFGTCIFRKLRPNKRCSAFPLWMLSCPCAMLRSACVCLSCLPLCNPKAGKLTRADAEPFIAPYRMQLHIRKHGEE